MAKNNIWKLISTIVIAKVWISGISVVGAIAIAVSRIQY